MEQIKNVERLAEENSNIAESEKESATEMIALASHTVKRAKAREMLVKTEIDLAIIRERLAEKTKKLVEKKEKSKELLKFADDNIKAEKHQAIYNSKVAEVQIKIAEIQRKIARAETEIGEVEVKIANKKFDEAKERGKLAKKQFAYVKLAKANAPPEKISRAEETYFKIQKDLTRFEMDRMELNRNIHIKQNKLADLKKELSEKLSEREKIRPA
ncbi:MAG: hypothetical protein ACFFKA_17130 [Candidatus Thorarchaeota archaeon]